MSLPASGALMRLLPLLLLLAACSNGLTALGDTDKVPVDPTDTSTPIEDTSEPDTEPPVNNPPVSNAGPDQTQPISSNVVLDGSASYDPDGDAISFQWSFVSTPAGSNTNLLNATRSGSSFYADKAGVYAVKLSVGDVQYVVDDTVQIVVEAPNDLPIAIAGPDQQVDVGDTVALNGGQSYDPDGGALQYGWQILSKPNGSVANLTSPASSLPSFKADVAGTYSIGLIVVDDEGSSSAPDTLKVVAQEPASSDCFSCAQANLAMERQWGLGTAASGPGLILLPLLVLLWQRKRDDE